VLKSLGSIVYIPVSNREWFFRFTENGANNKPEPTYDAFLTKRRLGTVGLFQMHSDWGEIAQGCGSRVQCFLHNNIRQAKRVWLVVKCSYRGVRL